MATVVLPGLAKQILDRLRIDYPDVSLIVVIADNNGHGNLGASVHSPDELRQAFVAASIYAIGMAATFQEPEPEAPLLANLPTDGQKH